MLKNIGDGFLVGIGIIQSFVKLILWRPDVIFTKGGYVCLPVGVAAHLLRIPLVIHDSDAHPGLTNRVLSRWATYIATGAPLEYYEYPKHKSSYVGIPIDSQFRVFTDKDHQQSKAEWGMHPDYPLLVVTGGGLGAKRINDAVARSLSQLLEFTSVILVAGAGQYDRLRALLPADNDRFQLHPFIATMPQLLAASDVVVTRAGATTILELSASYKPTILVPNAKLTGGHQLKNAKVYEDARAVIVVDEEQLIESSEILVSAVREVIDNPKQAQAMAKRFGSFAKPHAAQDVAALILKARKKRS